MFNILFMNMPGKQSLIRNNQGFNGETLTLPKHLLSPLVFIEVHVVLSFVYPYFM